MKDQRQTAYNLLKNREEQTDAEFISSVESQTSYKAKSFEEPKFPLQTSPEAAQSYIDRARNSYFGYEASMAASFLYALISQSTSKRKIAFSGSKPDSEEMDVSNYYEILGIDPDTPDSEIKDKVEASYKTLIENAKKNLDPVENKEIFQKIEEARVVLGNEKNRSDFNNIFYAKEPVKTKINEKNVELSVANLGAEVKEKYKLIRPGGEVDKTFVIKLISTKEIDENAKEKTNSFVNNALETRIDYDSADLLEMKTSGAIPEGTTLEELNLATVLYAKGADAFDLQGATEKNSLLSQEQKDSFYRVGDVLASYQTFNDNFSTQLKQANGTPIIKIDQIPVYEFRQTPQNIKLKWENNTFNPSNSVFQKAKDLSGKSLEKFKNNFKGSTKQRIKRGAVKRGVARGVKRSAVKVGAKTAVKLGIRGLLAGFSGGVTLALELGGRILGKLLKPITSRFSRFINKHGKDFLIAGAALAGLGFVTNSAIMLAGGIGILLSPILIPLFIFIAAAAVPAIGLSTILTIVGTPVLIGFILLVINSSAFVVPGPGDPIAYSPPGSGPPIQSRFMNVTKTTNASGQLPNDVDHLVTYTITITPLLEDITITNFNENCSVVSNSPLNCPGFENVTVQGQPVGTFPPPLPSTPINVGSSYVITYDMNFESPTFNDSLINNTFIVTANTQSSSGEVASARAYVIIGNPPSDCPSIWPVNLNNNYFVNQGPGGPVTHTNLEAIDVHVYPATRPPTATDVAIATHFGTVDSFGIDYYGGLYVNIRGSCGGSPFISRHVHFLSIDTSITLGMTVTPGTVLGRIGCTGYCNFPHDHYMFMDENYDNNPPFLMEWPYIPEDTPGQLRGCVFESGCNQYIP
jgi:curved DNA-binding protein CbpA